MEQFSGPYVKPTGPGQVVAYTGTAGTIANPIPMGASAIWIFCTSIAHVKWGASPTATTADFPVPASVPVVIQLDRNDGNIKVSAVQSAAGGNLHVCGLAY